eukprot:8668193-Pyramimonas_sp.AAC.2
MCHVFGQVAPSKVAALHSSFNHPAFPDWRDREGLAPNVQYHTCKVLRISIGLCVTPFCIGMTCNAYVCHKKPMGKLERGSLTGGSTCRKHRQKRATELTQCGYAQPFK